MTLTFDLEMTSKLWYVNFADPVDQTQWMYLNKTIFCEIRLIAVLEHPPIHCKNVIFWKSKLMNLTRFLRTSIEIAQKIFLAKSWPYAYSSLWYGPIYWISLVKWKIFISVDPVFTHMLDMATRRQHPCKSINSNITKPWQIKWGDIVLIQNEAYKP